MLVLLGNLEARDGSKLILTPTWMKTGSKPKPLESFLFATFSSPLEMPTLKKHPL